MFCLFPIVQCHVVFSNRGLLIRKYNVDVAVSPCTTHQTRAERVYSSLQVVACNFKNFGVKPCCGQKQAAIIFLMLILSTSRGRVREQHEKFGLRPTHTAHTKEFPKCIFQQPQHQSRNSQEELFIESLRNIILKRLLNNIIWEQLPQSK